MSEHPTRVALMDAAASLVEEHGLANVSVNDIVRTAGVAKGTFYVHFADRSSLLVAVHRRFHTHVTGVIADATTGLAPGVDRLTTAASAYLDACLGLVGVKAMLLEARTDLAVSADAAARERQLAEQAAKNFDVIGEPHPLAAARLYIALVAQAAVVELEHGRRDPSIRDQLTRWLTALAKQPT
jgi:TetR/AcrR family transcriptional repressor of nem operon